MEKTSKTIKEISFFKRMLFYPAYWLLILWNSTIRLRISAESKKILTQTNKPSMFFFWHNRLFVVGKMYHCFRKNKPIAGLISASKDGAWLALLYKLMNIGIIRGSSSRLAQDALKAIKDRLDSGVDVAITPDGPRGPCYKMKRGSILFAKKHDIPIILLSINFSSFWQLKSWDKFVIPRPFSKVYISCKRVQSLNSKDFEHLSDQELVDKIESELQESTKFPK